MTTPVTIRVLGKRRTVLATLRGKVREDDPREIQWEPSRIERSGEYSGVCELEVDGVVRGDIPMKLGLESWFYEGGILSPWLPLRFKEPLK